MRRILFFIVAFILLTAHSAMAAGEIRKVVVTNSNAWPPFSFINEEGQPRGLLIDLWKEFGRRNHVDIEFKLVAWSESLELMKTGGADIHAGLFESGERQKYLDFSKEMQVPLASRLFVSSKLNVQGFSDLGAMYLGLTEKDFAQEYLATNYPSLNVKAYPNAKEVVRAAVEGEVLAFVTDYPAAMYYLHKMGDPSEFRVVETLYTKKLQVAVRENNVEMLFFIAEGFENIPDEEIERITQKWIRSVETTPEWFYEGLFVGLGVLLLLFGAAYIIGLRRQVRLRTQELERLSHTDMLTGLYNRMRIEDILDRELYRAERYEQSLCLIMLDIDFFKQVNDTFGHAAGDSVLVEFADLLEGHVRRSDSVGRWGGEEFMIICPETDEESGVILAENLRKTIAQHSFESVQHCTASFGVTQYQASDDVGKVFERADMALYKAKVEGRNRVVAG